MDFKKKIETNTWENRGELWPIVEWILKNSQGGWGEKDKWTWIRNSRCKYVDIRIDMRDGGFVLLDRDGERITFDMLKSQGG